MQRVIFLPKLSSKVHIFVSRLVTFNETFALLNGTYPDFAVLWNASISGRCATDVTSSYVNILQLISADDITIWYDNCSVQNKTLFMAFAQVASQEWCPTRLRLEFLEKGHTFMRADAIHGTIGKRMKKSPIISTFNDFVSSVSKWGKNIQPILHHEFYDFVKKNRSRSSKGESIPLLGNVEEVEFRKYEQSFFI